MEEKTVAQSLKEELFLDNKNGYFKISEKDEENIENFAKGYVEFLNSSKTERLCVKNAIKEAKDNGFVEFDPDKKYNAGDKVFVNQRDKAVILSVIGARPVADGVRIVAAHIDSPRIDLKANPLYEADELGYFKTHYYGGIKKYQWTAMPLCLYGVVINSKGEKKEVAIGDKEGDPKFVITDLLPHLGAEQGKRTLSEGIKGEELNILIGSRPFKDDSVSEAVKLNLMKIINEKYGFLEADFRAAEFEFVPAFDACDIGFDHSLIGGYGHDDRVCAYPALKAVLDTEAPEFTTVTVLADKEETGSDGNTGLLCDYLKNFINDLALNNGTQGYRVLRNSKCLSADVNAAHDPTFADVSEKMNMSFINKGVVITKYTGSRGKGGTSDASAEYMGFVSKLLNENDVVWQTGELGKVDAGGGGTVAKYIANMDVETVDLGVPVLSMHAPFEVISKLDLYMAYKAFMAFNK
ncbi:MAG: aminopeptidase [Clostridia bacterium]|nr:aminopeptidase [Clostridia bacterium]